MVWLKQDINQCPHLGCCITFQTMFIKSVPQIPAKEREEMTFGQKKKILLCKCSVQKIWENILTQLHWADRETRRLNNIFTSITGQRGRPGRAFNGQPGRQGERGHVGRPGLRGHPGLRGAPGVCLTSGCAQLNTTSGTPQPAPRRSRNRQ